VDRWAPRADEAALGLGALFESLPARGRPASTVAEQAASTRARFLGTAGLGASEQAVAG
jgi:hypothetical protein